MSPHRRNSSLPPQLSHLRTAGQRTTGKYAVGIAAIIRAFKAGAPGLAISLLANEWDHMEIIAGAEPFAVFSYQTVFYFTSISACQQQAGVLCGAGENVAYVTKDGQNFTSILSFLNVNNVRFLGQLHGSTTPEVENPVGFWEALALYAQGTI